jgi:aspartyl-tRNA(Asn)/glutamyl-tRNA(Gln) amidotransferase subunit C
LHKQKVYDWPRFFQAFSTYFRVEKRTLVMSLTRADVENIAHLARLAITEAQLPVYVDSLSKILSFVEQLDAADTAAVEPMAHPLAEQVQRMRPDEVVDADLHEKYQRNAPSVAGGLYLVPKVIE